MIQEMRTVKKALLEEWEWQSELPPRSVCQITCNVYNLIHLNVFATNFYISFRDSLILKKYVLVFLVWYVMYALTNVWQKWVLHNVFFGKKTSELVVFSQILFPLFLIACVCL